MTQYYAQRIRTTFLSQGAPRKTWSEGPIFYQSQCIRTDVLSQIKHRTHLTIFYQSAIWHTARFFRSYCAWQWQARSLCWITSLWYFYRTESSAHGPFFYQTQTVGGKGSIFIGPKASTHKLIFTPIFLIKISPCDVRCWRTCNASTINHIYMTPDIEIVPAWNWSPNDSKHFARMECISTDKRHQRPSN